jgi:creatinine amidohydrolase
MKWVDLVPSDFERLVREENLCVVPMGSLERHGEHIPFGCDLVIAETIAEKAAAITPAVVFPGYFLAQVHEAACFTGTVNLPPALTVEVLSKVLDSIAANGFTKIAILNFHGGNRSFLEYFAMSQLDGQRDYVLYLVDAFHAMSKDEEQQFNSLWETEPLGHACELETSLYMACRPGLVKMEFAPDEPILPMKRFQHLWQNGIHNAHWWYADYPQNVIGVPAKASEEKGWKALEFLVNAAARSLQAVKDDKAAPALQREFLEKVRNKGK